ncbi:MAG: ATP-binding protein [Candidatus Bathyarchaeia archaeon]
MANWRAIDDLTLQLARQVELPFKPRFERFTDLYQALHKLWNGKVVVAIDEFQRLHRTGGVTELHAVWDSGDLGRDIMLILLGSSVGIIERLGLSYEGPLYGRASRIMKLRPMLYRDSRKFMTGLSEEDKVRAFGIFGGVPAYLVLLEKKSSLRDIIFELVLSQGAPLREEPLNMLSIETREPSRYMQILEAIADKSKVPIVEIHKYVRVLEKELDLVQRIYPLLEVKRGRARYRLTDAFTRFWFRFIRPHQSLLELGQEDEVLKMIIEKIDEHVASTFESVALEHMLTLRRAGTLHYQSIGKWWSREVEIDLVAIDERTSTAIFTEVKWTKTPIRREILLKLRAKAECFPWRKDSRRNLFLVYSRSGFDFAGEEDAYLFSLEDISRDLEKPSRPNRDDLSPTA